MEILSRDKYTALLEFIDSVDVSRAVHRRRIPELLRDARAVEPGAQTVEVPGEVYDKFMSFGSQSYEQTLATGAGQVSIYSTIRMAGAERRRVSGRTTLATTAPTGAASVAPSHPLPPTEGGLSALSGSPGPGSQPE